MNNSLNFPFIKRIYSYIQIYLVSNPKEVDIKTVENMSSLLSSLNLLKYLNKTEIERS